MALELGRPFAVDFRGFPPHMSAVDFVLWQRFLRRGPLPYLRLFFDVGVGQGVIPQGEVPENVRRSWERITQQRIDVVGEGADSWTILELRGAAGPGAIGSLAVYRSLWAADPPDGRPVRLVLITDTFSDNLRAALAEAQIELVLV